MNRRDQLRIVNEMAASVKRGFLAQLKANKIPASWDGHELRVLITNTYVNQIASVSVITREPKSQRAREFRNRCSVYDL